MPKYEKDKVEDYLGRVLRVTDPIAERVKESVDEFKSLLKEEPNLSTDSFTRSAIGSVTRSTRPK